MQAITNICSRLRNGFRRKILFNMPFAVRLNLSITGLLITAFIAVFIFTAKFFLPMIKKQVEAQALETIDDIFIYLSTNIKKAESAAKILNTYAYEDLNDGDNEINLWRMAYMSKNVMNILDPEQELFHGVFLYIGQEKGRKASFHQFFREKNGKIRVDNTSETETYGSREWLKTMETGKSFWTEPYIADDEKEKPVLITFAYPVSNKDESAGINETQAILGVALELKNVQKMFKSINFLQHGKALLLSKKGLYICHPDEKLQMNLTVHDLAKRPGLEPLAKMAEDLSEGKSGKVNMEKSTVVPGKSVFVFYGSQPDTGWGVSLVFSQDELFGRINRFNVRIGVAALLALILLIILVNIMCKHLSKSLEKLSEVAQEYGNGNFEAKFPNIYGTDEISRLAAAFRNMRDNIVQYINKEKENYAFEEKLSHDMAIAGKIQEASLEKNFPYDKSFEVYASMKPTKEIGGDFYDCFYVSPDKYAILIADVSGKGIPAALFMMMAKILIKTTARSGLAIADVFSEANKALCVKNDAEMFVTAFLGFIDIKTGSMEYVNAGHNPPIAKTKKGYDFFKPIKNIPLGYIDDYQYKSGKIKMEKGDRIFLYTDGITEAQNSKGEFYGSERLKNILNSLTDTYSPKYTLQAVNNSVIAFAGNAAQTDDMTMLSFVYAGNYATRTFQAKIETWPDVSVFIEGTSEAAGLGQAKTMKVLVSAEEIFSNIAQYAYPEPGFADISIMEKDGMLEVIFEDTGIPYNPLEKDDPDITLSAEERKIGGLGIFIVKKSMDKAEYRRENGKNIFTMGIKLD